MPVNSNEGIDIKCVECDKAIRTQLLNKCPSCKLPCHTKCAAKRTDDDPCDHEGLGIRCVVCDKTVRKQPPNKCPSCKMVCHTGCAGKKSNNPCDLCYNRKSDTEKSGKPLSTNKVRTIAQTQQSHLRRTPVKMSVPHNSRAPIITSTPATASLSPRRKGTRNTSTSLLGEGSQCASREADAKGPKSARTKQATGKSPPQPTLSGSLEPSDASPSFEDREADVTQALPLSTGLPAKKASNAGLVSNASSAISASSLNASGRGNIDYLDSLIVQNESASMAVKITDEEKKKEKSKYDNKKGEETEETEKKKKNNENVAPVLPRSRLSIFVPSPTPTVASTETLSSSTHSSLLGTPLPTSSTFSLNKSSRLDSSILKNGSIISSLVTYANSVRDTVEKAIVSQQDSIASKLVEIADSLTVLPSITQKISGLESKVDALQALLAEQTLQLRAAEKECELLREKINKSDVIIAKLVELESAHACNNSVPPRPSRVKTHQSTSRENEDDDDKVVSNSIINQSLSVKEFVYKCNRKHKYVVNKSRKTKNPSHRVSPSSIADAAISVDGQCEIVMTNIISDCDFDHKQSALAVLKSVLPSISADDIVSCRLAVRKEKGSSAITSNTRPSPIFVKMRSHSLVRNIIAAKKTINLLHTSDLEASTLSELEPSKIIATNIYINEALEAHSFRLFQNLKSVAKQLGFKYVWHRKGSFLAKWNDGERTHVFSSASDLTAVAAAYIPPATSPGRQD